MPINPSRILYEDDSLLAVNKLSGELVVKGKGRVDRLPLLDFLKESHPGVHPIHRLDFETSGVVVFAKTNDVLERIMSSKFAGWEKKYLTLVLENVKPETGVIDIPLEARMGGGKVQASTKYRVIEQLKHLSYVEATIERGQFHQIRRHFASFGHPLILDDEHGNVKFNKMFSKEFKFRDFFLHASSITFPHPVTGEKMHIEAPLPKVFEELLEKLRLFAKQ